MNASWLLISIVLYLLVATGVLLYAFRIKHSRFSDPIVQFVGFLTLFTLPLPIRSCMTGFPSGDVTEHLPELIPYMPLAMVLCALSLPWFAWGYYTSVSRKIAQKAWRPALGKHYYFSFLLITGFSLLLIFILAKGDIQQLILLGYSSSAETFGKGYLAVGFPWMFVGSLFLLCRYSAHREHRDLIFFGLAFTLLVGIELIMGNRGRIIYMLITVLLYWHHAIRPVTFKKAASIGAVAFIFLNLYGSVRGSRYESLADVLRRTTDSFDRLQEDGKATEASVYTITTGEFVVPFETLPQMIKSVGAEFRPWFGLSYLRAPVFYIPSAVYPGRPPSLGHWYMEQFYGSGWGLNEGRAFYFLAEGYLNFGPAGAFGIMLLWGVALGALHQYIRVANGQPAAVLLYALSAAFVFRGISGDFASMAVGLPEQSLSAAICGIWLTGRSR